MRKLRELAVLLLALGSGGPDALGAMEAQADGLVGGAQHVRRTSTGFWLLSADPERRLWLSVGGTVEQIRLLCAGKEPGPFSFVEVRAVGVPGEGRQVTHVEASAAQTVLWRMSQPMSWDEDFFRVEELFCRDVAAEPVAEGVSDGFLRDNSSATRSSWAWLGRGVLHTPAGEPLFFNHSGACRWHDLADPETFHCASRMELH